MADIGLFNSPCTEYNFLLMLKNYSTFLVTGSARSHLCPI